jgi:hypothetical protein
MTYLLGGAIAAAIFGAVWLLQRLFREPGTAGWKERAGGEEARADAAESAMTKQAAIADERQRALEKELHDYAASVAAEPDSRRRVQARWAEQAREASGEIDRADTVPDGKADPAAN